MIILDTHAWIWWADEPKRLSARARKTIEEAESIGVSAMSCWEAARLVARGRLDFRPDTPLWIAQALHMPRVELIELSPRIAIAAAYLDWNHGDPCDRIIVATATTRNAPIVSKDHRIRLYRPARAIW